MALAACSKGRIIVCFDSGRVGDKRSPGQDWSRLPKPYAAVIDKRFLMLKFSHNLDGLVWKCKSRAAQFIGVDGYQGAGKTTIARYISEKLSAELVSLDDYLVCRDGSYFNSINYLKLEADLLKSCLLRGPLVVEGVCLSAVLDTISLSPDFLVYVFSPEPNRGSPRGNGPLAREVSRYHKIYTPEKRAHVIFIAPDVPKEMYPMRSDRAEIDIAYIKSKTLVSITIGIGGMLTLIVGLIVLIFGISGNDETLVKFSGLEVSAKGLGAVIMATSIIWAFFAYQARPKYSHIREYSEKFDSNSNLLERFERESSTMAHFSANRENGQDTKRF